MFIAGSITSSVGSSLACSLEMMQFLKFFYSCRLAANREVKISGLSFINPMYFSFRHATRIAKLG
jgi:hypothetical protein